MQADANIWSRKIQRSCTNKIIGITTCDPCSFDNQTTALHQRFRTLAIVPLHIVSMSTLKRSLSNEAVEGICTSGKPIKRPYVETEGIMPSPLYFTSPNEISRIHMEALNNISDKVRFALKCIDRFAGEETSIKNSLNK